MQLAKNGFNLILISRTYKKLEDLKEVITIKYGVQCEIIAMDFTQDEFLDFCAVHELINKLVKSGTDFITILVNNVGISHDIPVPFIETSETEMTNIINVNCFCTLKITQLVAPFMIKSHKGLILNMASFAGVFPTPLLAVYSGSKAFLIAWSQALGEELKPSGVDVQVVNSYLVTSAMSKIKRTSALVPSPKNFVNACLRLTGSNRRGGSMSPYNCTPYPSHGMMQWVLKRFVPEWIILKVNYSQHQQIRNRAIKRQKRLEAIAKGE